MPVRETMVAEWILAGATIGLVGATAVLAWMTWHLYLATKHLASIERRVAERARIRSDIDMHADISEGNRWEWSPWDTSAADTGYGRWDEWRARCIQYHGRIYDPAMRTLYNEFVLMLRKQAGKDRWEVIFPGVRKEAEARLVDLRARLEDLDESLREG